MANNYAPGVVVGPAATPRAPWGARPANPSFVAPAAAELKARRALVTSSFGWMSSHSASILTSIISRFRNCAPSMLGRGLFNVEITIGFRHDQVAVTTLKGGIGCNAVLKLIMTRGVRFFYDAGPNGRPNIGQCRRFVGQCHTERAPFGSSTLARRSLAGTPRRPLRMWSFPFEK